jgi:hypothetical protein
MTNITMQTEGRRHYILGNTYAIKDRLRDAGAKWDPERKAWWTGKRDVAEQFAGQADAAPSSERPSRPDGERLTDDTELAGKATYKGKPYLLVWSGTTKRGQAAKLATMDGSRIFWADLADVTITKRYEARESRSTRGYRGRMESMTFGRLQRLRSEFAEQKQTERSLGAKDGLVGERAQIASRFEASRGNREPHRKVGEACWLKHQGARRAMVVVGFDLASYISRETAEDMGDYDCEPGWCGTLYYRLATLAEAQELQARDPREDAVLPEVAP